MGFNDLFELGGAWHTNETEFGNPRFRESDQEFLNMSFLHDVVWGDFDKDGDLDLAIAGKDRHGSGNSVEIYRNDGGNLFPGECQPFSADGRINASGDYDNDGDLDLVITSAFLRNDGGEFANDAPVTLATHDDGDIGDYDNDGDLDVVIAGVRGGKLYRNEGAAFTEDESQDFGDGGFRTQFASFADLDNDGDLDVAIGSYYIMRFYLNNNSTYILEQEVFGLIGRGAWGDYENDGRLDLAMSGHEYGYAGTPSTVIYKNQGGDPIEMSIDRLGILAGDPAWGDYDNDGDLDLIVAGRKLGGDNLFHPGTFIYQQINGQFIEDTREEIRQIVPSKVAWADYDQDGDLDFLVVGKDAENDWHTILYESIEADPDGNNNPNQPPSPPADGFSSIYRHQTLLLFWGEGSDDKTPTPGLYYNLRVGTFPGGNDIVSGAYGTPLFGNSGQRKFTFLKVPEQRYYWSVQTIDTGLAASAWSDEQVFH